ncbi:MAG: glycosyltransferase, partial [Actinomycetota bacterium]|nr:glycosyltransferase [Actinomycetota bacterium]
MERLRERGLDVDVVAPFRFRQFGIAYGTGVVANLRARPWLLVFVPAMLAAFTRATRGGGARCRCRSRALASEGRGRALDAKPFVLTLHGTDVELALRVPALARRIVERARIVICPSKALADAARALGGRDVQVSPTGVEIPTEVWPVGARPSASASGVHRRRGYQPGGRR